MESIYQNQKKLKTKNTKRNKYHFVTDNHLDCVDFFFPDRNATKSLTSTIETKRKSLARSGIVHFNGRCNKKAQNRINTNEKTNIVKKSI